MLDYIHELAWPVAVVLSSVIVATAYVVAIKITTQVTREVMKQ